MTAETVAARPGPLWASLPGRPDVIVSDDGQVRRLFADNQWRDLNAWRNSKGYLNVHVGERPCPDGDACRVKRRGGRHRHRVNMYVHRLVALAHVGDPGGEGDEWTVDHRNGDQLDNRVENLRWLRRPLNVNRFHPGWGSRDDHE